MQWAINLWDELELSATFLQHVPVATSISVEPASADDWEILELHAAYLEEQILNQLRIVHVGLKPAIWIHNRICIALAVVAVSPNTTLQMPCLRLTQNSEVIIAPKLRHNRKSKEIAATQSQADPPRIALRYLPIDHIRLPDAIQQNLLDTTILVSQHDFLDLVSFPSTCETVCVFLKHLEWDCLITHNSAENKEGSRNSSNSNSSNSSSSNDETAASFHNIPSKATGQVGSNTESESRSSLLPIAFGFIKAVACIPKGHVIVGSTVELQLRLVEPFSIIQITIPGGLLVHGSGGCGKTSIANVVSLRLARYHHFYHIILNCSQWRQTPPAQVADAIEHALIKAVWHAPSLVVFDNLDLVIPAETEQTDSMRSRTLANKLRELISKYIEPSKVFFMATAQHPSALHASLSQQHVFGRLVSIKPPRNEQRVEILKSMLSLNSHANADQVNFDSVAYNLDGFTVADIEQVVERAYECHAMRQMRESTQSPLSTNDFLASLDGFKPSSMQAVKLQTSNVAWSDIGGMQETKRMLIQTMQWPMLYPQIFAKSPLRLRSGLLLFGYPGCGKTMLASAVAKECGLNFISVKGPELLNKYIGASEKAVRDLFERAQAARPCCLFFDEFDSIAPRRGHDNTGVTDRVVNQMLTQMDGAEGLEGVFVLAATSRPDLIDPALLRPGRLDKTLLCDMPSLQDRIEIVKAISSKIAIDSNVTADWIASRTDGLTGADIQGLLNTAQIAAIREQMSDKLSLVRSSDSSNAQSSIDLPEYIICDDIANSKTNHSDMGRLRQKARRLSLLAVKQISTRSVDKSTTSTTNTKETTNSHQILVLERHITAAINSTRPSVTHEDRIRLWGIYSQFVNGKAGDAVKNIGTRSSLA
eukprot:jgi/Hompol1/277/HPOL_002470-RA